MKTLKTFFREREVLKNKSNLSIFGGILSEGTSSGSYSNKAGCTVNYTDTFEDKNDNGVRDCGENGTWNETVNC